MSNKVVTELTASNSGLNTGLNSGERAIRGYAGRVTSTMRGVAASLAGFFAVQKLASFAKEVRGLSMEADDAASKFETVFGPALGKVNAFVDEFANKAGFAKHELKDLLGTTGNILQGIGATADSSADLAEQMAVLAGDVASFNGATSNTPNVLRALQSALTGEREALKTYGIVVTQAEVDTLALGMAGKQSAKDLTQLEKAQATIVLATQKAAKANGDLDRTLDSASNKAASRAARWKDLKVAIGDSLAPAFDAAGDAASGFLREIERASPLINDMGEGLRDLTDDLFGVDDGLDDAASKITSFQAITTRTLVFIQMVWERTFKNIGLILDSFGKDIGGIIQAMVVLASEGPAAAKRFMDDFDKNFKRPELAGFDDLGAEFEKRVKDIEKTFDLMNREDEQKEKARKAREPREGIDVGDLPGKAAKPDKTSRTGGTESLTSLYDRIQGAAMNPQVKAMKEVKGAVDKAAEKIVAAVKGEDAPGAGAADDPLGVDAVAAALPDGGFGEIGAKAGKGTSAAERARKAAEVLRNRWLAQVENEDRQQQREQELKKSLEQNAERQRERRQQLDKMHEERGTKRGQAPAAAQRENPNDPRELHGKAAREREARRMERFANRFKQEDDLPKPKVPDPMDRIGEVLQFRYEARDRARQASAQRAMEAAAKARAASEERMQAAFDVIESAKKAERAGKTGTADEFMAAADETKRLGGKLDKLISETEATNQHLQNLKTTIPQLGSLAP